MENLKEALQYVVGLGNEAEKTEVLELSLIHISEPTRH